MPSARCSGESSGNSIPARRLVPQTSLENSAAGSSTRRGCPSCGARCCLHVVVGVQTTVERLPEVHDLLVEQLAVVPLVGGHAESLGRSRAADRDVPSMTVVELLVTHRGVVGPLQQLRVRAVVVIPLVEHVECRLPVRGEHGGAVPEEAHALEVQRVEVLAEGSEVLVERAGSGIRAHPQEAPIGVRSAARPDAARASRAW